MEVHIEAAAKLNLHLQVGEIRKDGFHDIVSIFHLVDLSDSLIIRSKGEAGSVAVDGNFGFPEKENILYKTALLYFAAWKEARGTGPAFGVEVECFKRIPLGGGLGGGSSNAAALLKVLEILSGNPLGKEILFSVAEELGSDIPFFLASAAEMVTGRGEILKPLKPLPEYPVLLVFPPWKMDTGKAYAAVDARKQQIPPKERLTETRLPAGDYETLMRRGLFYNDFTSALAGEHRDIEEITKLLKRCGAFHSDLSGSGSTVFGIFEISRGVEEACKALESTGYPYHSGKMLARPYEPVYNGHYIQ